MVSITIREPLETRNELATRAARVGRSLPEDLRGERVALAARPDHAGLAELHGVPLATRDRRPAAASGPRCEFLLPS